MDLVADIGNTRCKLGAFEAGRLVAKSAAARTPADWDAFVEGLAVPPTRVAVSSVNPGAKAPFVEWVRARLGLEPRVLGVDLAVRLPLDVEAPDKVGTDRLANALWAARRNPGRAVVVVDFGTAISMAVVDSKGTFRGGAIAPGVSTQARALSEHTAQLPLVAVGRAPVAIGRSTAACIEAGIFYGAVGLVDAIAERMDAILGEKALVVATGGDAELVASGSRRIERVVPDLTLEGVALALAEGAV